jgi:hypothetical protein
MVKELRLEFGEGHTSPNARIYIDNYVCKARIH